MKTVTALRADSPGRVAVELDGGRWRTLPLEAVVKARLAAGAPLDRPRARELAREIRRLAALGRAVSALRRSDRSAAELDATLRGRGVAPAERERALDSLGRAGLIDDARVARTRATSLAERGNGNALIRHDLEQRGIAPGIVDAVLEEIAPESERALAIVARRGRSARTARYLTSRGFGEDTVEAVVAWEPDEEVG